MFYRILRISAVIFLISSSSYSSTFKDAFDANTHHNSVGYSDSTNITGLLAWNESYAMMAFLSMFRATNDADYLNKLIFHAKNVIGNIDDSIYIVDPSRGIDVTMGPAWNTHLLTNDSLGVYHDYAKVVGSGMICYPIADFAQLVKNNLCLQDSIYPATGETYNAIADTFITIVDKVIAAHDDQWSVSDFGYKFRNVSWLHLANWPKGGVGGRILPINMQLVMGRTLLMMYLANGNPSYLQKVKCLIYRFKYHTDLKISGDQYLWKYWKKYEPDKCEDISHGSICADFSRLCYIHGDEIMSSINFSQDDTTRFASIVTESLYQQPLYIHYRIDGSGDNSLDLRIGRWLHYSRYHKDIYQIVADMFSQNAIYEQGKWLGGSDFLGLANLVLYKEYFDPIAVYRGNGPNSDWAGITAGDFNDDGVDEIAAVRNYDGNFYVYGLNSSNEFISVASYTEMGPNSEWAGITAGDFNNNGIDEIAAVSNQEGKFYVYKLNSLNQFVEIASDTGIGLNADWAGITSGNFDNDEADEIAAVSNQEGNFYVYKLNFLNQLVEIASYTGMGPNSDWRGICAGNFESDNADEIVAVRNFDNDFYIYNVDGSIFTRLGQEHFPVGFENNILGSGKCSNGTQDDLIIARNSDGDIGLFSINAPTTPVFMTDPVQESAPIESDLALQNQTVITDNVHFAANTITTGPAYTIENNAHMIFVSGNTITLQDGFHAKNGCEFYATVDPQLNNPPPLGKRSACANIISDQSQDLKDLDIKSTEQNGVDQEIPTQFSLSCNRPNPFNPITVIPYALPEARCVRLVIYNMMGQKVRTLVDETKEAGFWQVNWDCCDDRGQVLSSGVYICLIEAGEFVKTRKMVLLR